jgi:hypothetical protein
MPSLIRCGSRGNPCTARASDEPTHGGWAPGASPPRRPVPRTGRTPVKCCCFLDRRSVSSPHAGVTQYQIALRANHRTSSAPCVSLLRTGRLWVVLAEMDTALVASTDALTISMVSQLAHRGDGRRDPMVRADRDGADRDGADREGRAWGSGRGSVWVISEPGRGARVSRRAALVMWSGGRRSDSRSDASQGDGLQELPGRPWAVSQLTTSSTQVGRDWWTMNRCAVLGRSSCVTSQPQWAL